MEIINGTNIAVEIRNQLKVKNEQRNVCPNLAIFLVGDDKESMVYVGLKDKAAATIAGRTTLFHLPADIQKEELLQKIQEANADHEIHGIILQLPLPDHLKPYQDDFLSAIQPDKDVDGFNPINRGKLMGGQAIFISCAAMACMEIVDRYQESLDGKKAVLFGDSFDVIQPLAILFMQRGCLVSIIPDYRAEYAGDADIMVVEKGAARVVKGDHLKKGMLLIDAGFFFDQRGVSGNVDKDSLTEAEGYLLPVPGGMGPLLIARLMENVSAAVD